ncbi:MAG: translation initiation factor IF-2 subunit beta [Candidatus Altiarchaeales archaeon HGW-Altiarchaeales-1]|nr:MAG: translation initiation factor IF-2 subunit beta [Candidatus Altiarchaeales archaeon HGW-Altiarchaeales-1]
MDEYDSMLERAMNKLPRMALRHQRFEIPKISSFIERPQEEIFTFLLKELASRGDIEKGRAIIERPMKDEMINDKIKKYTNEFVLCKECGKPDTKIDVIEGHTALRCMACGAWRFVRKI